MPLLTATNLKSRYRNGALGISDVSVEVDAGQIICLFGPNGAGKTTTVRSISGFLRSEGAKVVGGQVRLGGKDITNLEPHQANRLGISFVPERQKIFTGLSVADNLEAVGRRPARARRQDLAKRVYELFPMLAGAQHTLAGRLSGGQQQMLAIARSMMCDARLLIVDEMTLGLHHSVYEPLFDVVRALAKEGAAVILVDESTSQVLDVADYCYLLNGGTVRLSGRPADFRGNELLAAGYVEAS